ncbi:Inositol 2-dehydrogenase/D-chiro-inositol 3-dehydrogenase [Thalassoglobus neptunius]|uniref:Inositol 2-dehydrogenase/D-chiro-inositol 3-dehydrogenase n=1 Tax=Thalassoglobus neptunius TaxID=1938619 RepID=A0A5C5X0N4_9PLAN|nr:Gfo/Idh/MocA family oxidoreductase [Thalassoglobus neptunius]TWT56704.1 Inositol 2-dehydrogenase/D-chiro-inositol 3-dehydrogenase [Thalassoglobus neptunius]
MTDRASSPLSRRELLKTSTKAAAATAVASMVLPKAYAAEDNTIQIALVGCGGRGTGAADNALSVQNGNLKLVAMADVFEGRQSTSYNALSGKHGDKVDVPEERRHIGFEAYKAAMDQLRPGDIVILTTPPGFRWVHYTYAIEKGLNVFMEKPVTVDGPSSRKMLALNEKAKEKNLKVGVGLMCRHCEARGELFDRIQNGEIGDLILMRAYRMVGPTGSAFAPPNDGSLSEVMYQIKNFHGFLWASGGAYSDFLIHNIDETCWMKNAWPVEAQASGGRNYRGKFVDQNFDTYSVEYTFADGSKFFLEGRNMVGCHQEFASYAQGSKGSAIISTSSHFPARSRIFKGQKMDKDNQVWAFGRKEVTPYQLEWDHLISAIRNDQPYNEVQRGVEASVVTSMGRMAAHTGQIVTFDDMLNCEHEFAPTIDSLTVDGPAPLVAGANGKYPIPLPGIIKSSEY